MYWVRKIIRLFVIGLLFLILGVALLYALQFAFNKSPTNADIFWLLVVLPVAAMLISVLIWLSRWQWRKYKVIQQKQKEAQLKEERRVSENIAREKDRRFDALEVLEHFVLLPRSEREPNTDALDLAMIAEPVFKPNWISIDDEEVVVVSAALEEIDPPDDHSGGPDRLLFIVEQLTQKLSHSPAIHALNALAETARPKKYHESDVPFWQLPKNTTPRLCIHIFGPELHYSHQPLIKKANELIQPHLVPGVLLETNVVYANEHSVLSALTVMVDAVNENETTVHFVLALDTWFGFHRLSNLVKKTGRKDWSAVQQRMYFCPMEGGCAVSLTSTQLVKQFELQTQGALKRTSSTLLQQQGVIPSTSELDCLHNALLSNAENFDSDPFPLEQIYLDTGHISSRLVHATARVNDLPRASAAHVYRDERSTPQLPVAAEPPETQHIRMTLHLPGPVGALLSVLAALRNKNSQHMIAAVHDEHAVSAISVIRTADAQEVSANA